MKHFRRYSAAFCLTLALAVLALVLSALLPQGPIDRHVADSAYEFSEEPSYPRILDKTYGSRLDYWTDAIMLMQSKAMSAQQLERVLTNPMFSYGGQYPQEDLLEYVRDDNPTPTSYYTRYWMGYRALLRPALVFLDYLQIKRYVAFALFALFAALIVSITQRCGRKVAMAFAVSVILIRPYVVCDCLQFSCCFLIAFAAMLLVPWLSRNPAYEGVFFLVVGMITMYFDFYTTPIVTFGLPMVYLYLLRTSQGAEMSCRHVARGFLIWFAGYGLMWGAKLLLTSLLTAEDGVANGLNAFYTWMGVAGHTREGATYNPLLALAAVAVPVLSDLEGALVIGLVLLIVVWIFILNRKKISVVGGG